VSAQIVWDQDYRGKRINCGVSGLSGFGDRCEFQHYDAAIVGGIISSEALPGTNFASGDVPRECPPQFFRGPEWDRFKFNNQVYDVKVGSAGSSYSFHVPRDELQFYVR
jgi:hypothetical protein